MLRNTELDLGIARKEVSQRKYKNKMKMKGKMVIRYGKKIK